MRRLAKKEKELVIKLIKNGKSLAKISEITNRNKSTLYYYYKKIKGKKFKDVNLKNVKDEVIGELLGVFAGDGYTFFDKKSYKYSTRIFLNKTEEVYANSLGELFEKHLLKRPNIRKEKSDNIITLTYYTKKLHNFILENVKWGISKNSIGHNKKSRTVFLKQLNRSKEFKVGFLRGCLDSDGHISKSKINFASSSKKLIEIIKLFLTDVGINNFNKYFYDDKRGNRVGIYHIDVNKSEREKFIEAINPRNRCKM